LRADKTEFTGDSYLPESLGDKAEQAVSEFFGGGQDASAVLKSQLEDYVSEGGSPILGALGATGLDVLNLAMGFTEGTALGLSDTRNLGEGVKKGTLEGAKEDAARLLNILPQGRFAKVINTVLTVSDIAEATANNDAASLTTTVGFGIMGAAGGKSGKGKKGNKKKGKKGKNKGELDKKKKYNGNYEHGIDPHTVTEIVKNRERHHAVLQALFKRLVNSELASFIHEGPSHPIPLKLHQKIHKELNEMLRKEGFLERYGQPRAKLTKEEFMRALQKIEEFYMEKSLKNPNIKAFGELKDTVKTFRRTLENIGLI
jgi:hypothetical protein